jgi:TRAP-type C4-dicarboxylate transport system permease small subunit
MRLLARVNALIERWLGAALAALVALLVLVLLWQVLSRFVARLAIALGTTPWLEPARSSEELATFCLAWTAMLGSAYALRRGEHIGLDVLYLRVGASERALFDSVARIAVAGFALVMLIGGSLLTAMTFDLGQRLPALGWQAGWVYLAIPCAGALLLAFAAERVFSHAGSEGLS